MVSGLLPKLGATETACPVPEKPLGREKVRSWERLAGRASSLSPLYPMGVTARWCLPGAGFARQPQNKGAEEDMARPGVPSGAQLGASQLLGTVTPLGRALGSTRLQAAPGYLEREKRNKSSDVTYEITGLWRNRDLHLSIEEEEEEEEEAIFSQLPPTPACGAGTEPTFLGLSHPEQGAGPRTPPSCFGVGAGWHQGDAGP